MASVTIYTRDFCGYCAAALRLLTEKGVKFDQIDAAHGTPKREEMIKRANGASTYPQIFIDDMHIGGCDDLMMLERKGKLDALLAAGGS
ncbi:MAG: glutaredoxin 3 [Hirschia sp.]|nr:glutaredoxin 3 [Hirschia sp.]MBF17821.1 glutaredoxin 3 [Hirschia sp.]|tara:strand:- start:111 stop:377 length:267 start_codon:yes stop_codon:yes gene_type:complete